MRYTVVCFITERNRIEYSIIQDFVPIPRTMSLPLLRCGAPSPSASKYPDIGYDYDS